MKIKWLCVSSTLAAAMISVACVWADAPVEDISSQSQSPQSVDNTAASSQTERLTTISAPPVLLPIQPDLKIVQRLSRLEQQLNNIVNMNLPQQISDLQQEFAQIRGQLQVQKCNLQLLDNQQRNFYRDPDQQITQSKNLNSCSNSDVSNNNASLSSQKNLIDDNAWSTSNIQLKDSNTYRKALDLLTRQQYDKAEVEFQTYLNNYPNGSYAANSHYWLGEIYFKQKDRDSKDQKGAIREFKTVRDKFPKSEKVLDARLKLAIIDAEDGKIKQAEDELTQIKRQYPESTAAQLANIRLQQLEEEDSKITSP